jgi:hypothetical protein
MTAAKFQMLLSIYCHVALCANQFQSLAVCSLSSVVVTCVYCVYGILCGYHVYVNKLLVFSVKYAIGV